MTRLVSHSINTHHTKENIAVRTDRTITDDGVVITTTTTSVRIDDIGVFINTVFGRGQCRLCAARTYPRDVELLVGGTGEICTECAVAVGLDPLVALLDAWHERRAAWSVANPDRGYDDPMLEALFDAADESGRVRPGLLVPSGSVA